MSTDVILLDTNTIEREATGNTFERNRPITARTNEIETGVIIDTMIHEDNLTTQQSVQIEYKSVLLSDGNTFEVGQFVRCYANSAKENPANGNPGAGYLGQHHEDGTHSQVIGELLSITRCILDSGQNQDTCKIRLLYTYDQVLAECSGSELTELMKFKNEEEFIQTDYIEEYSISHLVRHVRNPSLSSAFQFHKGKILCLAPQKLNSLKRVQEPSDDREKPTEQQEPKRLKLDVSQESENEQNEQNEQLEQRQEKVEIQVQTVIAPALIAPTFIAPQLIPTRGAELLRNKTRSRYWRTQIQPYINEISNGSPRLQHLYRTYFLAELQTYITDNSTQEDCDLIFQPILLPDDYCVKSRDCLLVAE